MGEQLSHHSRGGGGMSAAHIRGKQRKPQAVRVPQEPEWVPKLSSCGGCAPPFSLGFCQLGCSDIRVPRDPQSLDTMRSLLLGR